LGEGLVGQVAQDQCPLLLDAVPADYLTVTSALGEAAPRQLVIMPFLFEGYVTGVVEIGSLTRFTPAQTSFLQAAMGNVAIAFNTAQARVYQRAAYSVMRPKSND
ncbi:MAG: GAF domain-containing protein, partial [Anaerolineae bacterium]|nr:GAF domain-containing protein [Anaerolineae bacterium]